MSKPKAVATRGYAPKLRAIEGEYKAARAQCISNLNRLVKPGLALAKAREVFTGARESVDESVAKGSARFVRAIYDSVFSTAKSRNYETWGSIMGQEFNLMASDSGWDKAAQKIVRNPWSNLAAVAFHSPEVLKNYAAGRYGTKQTPSLQKAASAARQAATGGVVEMSDKTARKRRDSLKHLSPNAIIIIYRGLTEAYKRAVTALNKAAKTKASGRSLKDGAARNPARIRRSPANN